MRVPGVSVIEFATSVFVKSVVWVVGVLIIAGFMLPVIIDDAVVMCDFISAPRRTIE